MTIEDKKQKSKDPRDKENWVYLKPMTPFEQLEWSRVPSGQSVVWIKKWIENNQNKDLNNG